MIDFSNILDSDPNAIHRSYQKGDIIQKAESSRTSSVYVKKGILRSYTIDSNGKEHIYAFALEGYFIGDLEAIEFNQNAQLFIDCIENSEVILFDQERLLANLSKQEVILFNQLLRRSIGKLQRRVLMLMGAPAQDRYLYFLETYPNLLNRIPQKMIASYLGIAPQTLSTIRRKISDSK